MSTDRPRFRCIYCQAPGPPKTYSGTHNAALVAGVICAALLALPSFICALLLLVGAVAPEVGDSTPSQSPACGFLCCGGLGVFFLLPLFVATVFFRESYHYCRRCGIKLG